MKKCLFGLLIAVAAGLLPATASAAVMPSKAVRTAVGHWYFYHYVVEIGQLGSDASQIYVDELSSGTTSGRLASDAQTVYGDALTDRAEYPAPYKPLQREWSSMLTDVMVCMDDFTVVILKTADGASNADIVAASDRAMSALVTAIQEEKALGVTLKQLGFQPWAGISMLPLRGV